MIFYEFLAVVRGPELKSPDSLSKERFVFLATVRHPPVLVSCTRLYVPSLLAVILYLPLAATPYLPFDSEERVLSSAVREAPW